MYEVLRSSIRAFEERLDGEGATSHAAQALHTFSKKTTGGSAHGRVPRHTLRRPSTHFLWMPESESVFTLIATPLAHRRGWEGALLVQRSLEFIKSPRVFVDCTVHELRSEQALILDA